MAETKIERLLESLCECFDTELERQENVLAISVAQGKAARMQDIEYLEAKTAALNALYQEAAKAETARLDLLHQVVTWYGIPEEHQNLAGLIAAVPDPWKSRMREFRLQMRTTIEETQRVAKQNKRAMRRAIKAVNQALGSLTGCLPPAAASYDDRGAESARSAAPPNLIINTLG